AACPEVLGLDFARLRRSTPPPAPRTSATRPMMTRGNMLFFGVRPGSEGAGTSAWTSAGRTARGSDATGCACAGNPRDVACTDGASYGETLDVAGGAKM